MSQQDDGTPAEVADEPEQEQVAFDINDFPGGARSAVEAVLMVIDEPVTEESLASALELPVEDVGAVLDDLAQEYAQGNRGFMLRRLGGGWRVYSRPEYAPVVEKFLLGGQQARLTQAALETLAVIAYRQPISRARIGAIRGVNVDGVVRTLLARGMVTETGQDPTGGAVLYGTTDLFLQRMGLDTLDDLPALAPYLPSAEVLEELASEGLA
ncbi:Segregation and condensation protein B [Serinicoccus hydrothermalis]|uniref:Segregation and condensation protein B n=1 Tax=Serinicoccus hydrothermalis TaxID=1758689 RepID=A0A1B1N8R8_9MICO|nr:SMC-Scp complex subunit ScpB [Serinicoccus hydrothermalis]ANS77816.1 Segregation and condensation protein B [Serinicoccus hydrothermalis]